ncbi:uncharacterized protein PB18E9.04c-like, partial [Homarus americanus]|uniref:uncharacterized protein PB18E9.04c-like n=1 Tax=Homarus americanus TaxID=6706 RepID=UPI001C47FDFA
STSKLLVVLEYFQSLCCLQRVLHKLLVVLEYFHEPLCCLRSTATGAACVVQEYFHNSLCCPRVLPQPPVLSKSPSTTSCVGQDSTTSCPQHQQLPAQQLRNQLTHTTAAPPIAHSNTSCLTQLAACTKVAPQADPHNSFTTSGPIEQLHNQLPHTKESTISILTAPPAASRNSCATSCSHTRAAPPATVSHTKLHHQLPHTTAAPPTASRNSSTTSCFYTSSTTSCLTQQLQHQLPYTTAAPQAASHMLHTSCLKMLHHQLLHRTVEPPASSETVTTGYTRTTSLTQQQHHQLPYTTAAPPASSHNSTPAASYNCCTTIYLTEQLPYATAAPPAASHNISTTSYLAQQQHY